MDNDASILFQGWVKRSDQLISDIRSMEMNRELSEKIVDFISGLVSPIRSSIDDITAANETIYACRQLCDEILSASGDEIEQPLIRTIY